MPKINKAIIPLAGLGTRFLPATYTVPKELFPLVDTPILLKVMEEALDAGIEEFVFIQKDNSFINSLFEHNPLLEAHLEKTNSLNLIAKLSYIKQSSKISSVDQGAPLGLGHAILQGRKLVGHEPFAVLLADVVSLPKDKTLSPTQQLIHCWEQNNTSTISVQKVAPSEVHKYGIIEYDQSINTPPFSVISLVEKPSAEEAPSNYSIPGRYVFDNKIFDYLASTAPGINGEIQLTDAMTQLARNEGLLALPLEAKCFDAGDKLGYLIANIEFCLEHNELSGKLTQYLKNLNLP